ncbi:MAG: hypothetical protein A2Y69_01935 [Candidatus Aminicenantes bacterium RBG_13_59_9]|nr:MAG: hypothetical protein A2Y69_01935 [Candidatus Aminicenantes bacterium RBG_13_59_9]
MIVVFRYFFRHRNDLSAGTIKSGCAALTYFYHNDSLQSNRTDLGTFPKGTPYFFNLFIFNKIKIDRFVLLKKRKKKMFPKERGYSQGALAF